MSAKIRANERYVNDACNCIFENLVQGIKRREENSIWGPVELPVINSNVFNECFPTKIIKSGLAEEGVVTDVNNARLHRKTKTINHVSTGNSSSKVFASKTVSNKECSVLTEKKVFNGIADWNEDTNNIATCLHYEELQCSENNGASKVQNLDSDIDRSDLTNSFRCSVENNSSDSGHFSDIQSENENKSSPVKQKTFESANLKHLGPEVMASKVKSTSNVNNNPVNTNEELKYVVEKKPCNDFKQWCINRKNDYRSRSNLSLCDSSSVVMKHDKQHISSDKRNECEISRLSNTLSWKSKEHDDDDDFEIDGKCFGKTNLSDNKPASDFQCSSVTNIEKKIEFCDSLLNQEVPNFTEKISKDDYILENNPQCLLEAPHNKMNAIDLKEQYDDDDSISEIKIEDLFSTELAQIDQKELSKPVEFVSELYNSNTLGLSCRRRTRNELPPRFQKNKIEKSNTEAKEQSMSEDFNFEIKLHNEALKEKKTRKKKNVELPSRFRNNKIEKNNTEVKKQSMLENKTVKTKLYNENSKEKRKVITSHASQNTSSSNFKINLFPSIQEKIHLSFKVKDEKCDKDFEFMIDSFAISRVKRTLPELSANVPDIDSGDKELPYSADAMNIVMRFVFCRSFNFVMPSVAVGVEVLAAAYSWNIADFIKLYQDKFLKNVLTPANANLVFSHACHYNLQEICDACKNIAPDNLVLNNVMPKKKRKVSLVSISTFIEPSELSFPFEPIETDISLSFKKQVDNTFTLKAVSGSYSITGFQIQLNEEYLAQKDANGNMLEIDYSIKKVDGSQAIEGTEKKPLRSINIIYFKKPLVLKPKEVGEIFIQTEIEPYLCSAHKERKITFRDSAGELNLRMESNRKVYNPDRRLFLVGKFFYTVNKSL